MTYIFKDCATEENIAITAYGKLIAHNDPVEPKT